MFVTYANLHCANLIIIMSENTLLLVAGTTNLQTSCLLRTAVVPHLVAHQGAKLQDVRIFYTFSRLENTSLQNTVQVSNIQTALKPRR